MPKPFKLSYNQLTRDANEMDLEIKKYKIEDCQKQETLTKQTALWLVNSLDNLEVLKTFEAMEQDANLLKLIKDIKHLILSFEQIKHLLDA